MLAHLHILKSRSEFDHNYRKVHASPICGAQASSWPSWCLGRHILVHYSICWDSPVFQGTGQGPVSQPLSLGWFPAPAHTGPWTPPENLSVSWEFGVEPLKHTLESLLPRAHLGTENPGPCRNSLHSHAALPPLTGENPAPSLSSF